MTWNGVDSAWSGRELGGYKAGHGAKKAGGGVLQHVEMSACCWRWSSSRCALWNDLHRACDSHAAVDCVCAVSATASICETVYHVRESHVPPASDRMAFFVPALPPPFALYNGVVVCETVHYVYTGRLSTRLEGPSAADQRRSTNLGRLGGLWARLARVRFGMVRLWIE